MLNLFQHLKILKQVQDDKINLMDIQHLIEEYRKDMTTSKFLEKFDYELRHSPSYSNLDESNRKLAYEVIKKYSEKIKDGRGLSAENIHDSTHKIFENRLKLKITDDDLKDIREILGMFRS